MTARFDAARWLKPENVVLVLFLAVLVWMPFPYGSNRPWAEIAAALSLSGLLLAWGGLVMSGVTPQTPLLRNLKWPALCTAVALGWGAVQAIDLRQVQSMLGLDLAWLSHPLWDQAANALGSQTGAFISIDPAATRQALVAALVPVMAFLLAFNLGRDRDRAAILSGTVVFAGIACAAVAAAQVMFALDLQTALLPEERPKLATFAAPFLNEEHLGALLALAALAALGSFAERFRQSVPWDLDTLATLKGVGRSLEGSDGALLIVGVGLLAALLATGSGVATGGFLSGMILLTLVLANVPDEDEPQALGRRAVAALLIAITGATVALGGPSLTERFGPPALDAASRQSIAAATLEAIATAPLSGQGFGAFERYNLMSANLSAPGVVEEAGNDVLEPIADLGIPAGLAFIAAPLLVVLQCLAGAATRRRDRAFPAVAAAAALCMGVHAMAGFSLQVPAISVSFAVLLGIGAVQSWRTNMDLVR